METYNEIKNALESKKAKLEGTNLLQILEKYGKLGNWITEEANFLVADGSKEISELCLKIRTLKLETINFTDKFKITYFDKERNPLAMLKNIMNEMDSLEWYPITHTGIRLKDCITIVEGFELAYEYKCWIEKIKSDPTFYTNELELINLEEHYRNLIDAMFDVAELRNNKYEGLTVDFILKIIMFKDVYDIEMEINSKFDNNWEKL